MGHSLNEIATINYPHFDGIATFAVTRSKGNRFCVFAKQRSEMLELNYNFIDVDEIKFKLSKCKRVPASLPPTVDKLESMKRIYYQSDDAQKQELCLNSFLMQPINASTLTASHTSMLWSPEYNGTSFIATLMSDGNCVILQKSASTRSWDSEVLNLSSHWQQYCAKKTSSALVDCDLFDLYYNDVQHTRITAIAWNNVVVNNSCAILMITESGRVAVITVVDTTTDMSLRNIHFDAELTTTRVNQAKWFSCDADTDDKKSILCTGDIFGNVCLYEVKYESKNGHVTSISNKVQLWADNDHIRAGDIQIDFDMKHQSYVVIICKMAYLVVFVIPVKDTANFTTILHGLDGHSISGIAQITPMKYVICTLDGIVQNVIVSVENSKLIVTELECNFNSNKYAVYGVAVSIREAFYMFVLYPRETNDHLVLRQPLCISICSVSTDAVLEKLLKNTSFSLTDYYDCAEVLRFSELKKEIIPEHFLTPIVVRSEPFDLENLYNLKVTSLFLMSRAGYLRRSCRMRDLSNLQYELDLIRETILAITYYRRLQKVFDNKTNMCATNFQKLSANCLRIFLMEYIDKVIEHKSEERLKIIVDRISALCKELQFLESTAPELCNYCNDFVETNKLTCKEHHTVYRCCISLVQVPIVNYRRCSKCEAAALDKIEYLRQATYTMDSTFFCPLCDDTLVLN